MAGTQAAAGDLDLRLRIAWGGGTERAWRGDIALSEGKLADSHPLGIEADEAGSIWLDPQPPAALKIRGKGKDPAPKTSSDHVVIRQRSARTYDGLDLSVTAPPEALLLVSLSPVDDSKTPQWIDVRLADVLRNGFAADVDDRGNRLVVHRSPGDDLRVRLPRRSLVFAPEEQFKCEVLPCLASMPPGTKVRVKLQVLTARTSEELWTEERSATAGDPTPIAVEFPLSNLVEGVYDLVVSATQAGKFAWPQQVRPPLGFRPAVVERSIQFVVLTPKPLPPGAGDNRQIVEIDPANPTWWDRLAKLPQWSRLARLPKGPMGNGNLRTAQHPLGAVAELAPSKDGDANWEAYALPISRPGEPHVLEVDYPSNVPQTLGISIVEPNAAGAVVPIGLDSGIDQPEELAGGPPCWLRHRVVFWPRTKTPVVLMTNRRDRQPAVYGKLRVLAGWSRLPRAFPPGPPPERLIAGYLDRPLFPENFSASESLGSLSELSVDDWVTFYEGGTRLVEYLHYAGYNGLMLSVMADGSAIYPSAVFDPTPRYDTGEFFASGQDPVRKDVLEMVLRLFDRAGLQLVPAMEFAAPLPALESVLRAGGAEAEAIQWIGPEGTAWTATYPPHRGKAPYYNVLHPRVQEAMLAAVREVAADYARHPSFAGLALQLSAHGYAQLPGPEWGLDDATVARFERDTKVRLPEVQGVERFARRAQALGPIGQDGRREWRREWLDWRAAQMTRFYRRVFEELVAVRPGGRLYLAGGEMFGGPEWEKELRPSLPRRTTIAEAMLRAGIDARLFGDDRGIVLLRPQRIAPQWALARRAIDLEVEQMPDLDRYFQSLWPAGAMFFHCPQELRLASFDEKGPFRPCYTWLASEHVPSGGQNRRRFVHALATLDPQAMFDGGWMLPLGQEDTIRDIVAVYRQLPAVRFERVEDAGASGGQTITVRYAPRADRTYAYMVNDAPFPATARVRVELPAGCQMQPLGVGRSVGPLRRDEEGTYWEAELGPYDLVAAWFSAPGVRFSLPQAAHPRDIQPLLERRLSDLGDRLAALPFPPALERLQNPGFDLPPQQAGQVPGWFTIAPPGVTVQLDKNTKENGACSVRVASNGPAGGLISHTFPAPATGRISLSVWLRVDDATKQPSVRLTIAGRARNRDFYRSAFAGQGGAGAAVPPIAAQWNRFVVHVSDLPLEDISQLHVRLELMGPGEVWFDDVQLCDLAFDPQERKALGRVLTPAGVMLQSGQVGDCLHLLEGYWPRFLAENVPLAAVPVARKSDAAVDLPKESSRSSSLLDRVKGLVPERRR